MINEFSNKPTKNHTAHKDVMSELSITAVIRAVDYINLLSQFVNSSSEALDEQFYTGENEVLDEIDNILEPLNAVINKLRTEETCVHCGGFLYKSDLPQYNYVCPGCDENF